MDPIRVTDAGDYRCRVDFKKARTVNTVISLKVIVPPEEPVITDEEGNELKGLVGPYNEGDSLRLVCVASGGQPRPALTWWRDYSSIDSTFELSTHGATTTNRLTIASLARHHLLSILTCQAVNNNITVPASTSLTLDMNLKPTDVRITLLSGSQLVADREAVLECTATGSRPKALLSWSFDGQRFSTPLASPSSPDQSTSSMTIRPKREHHGSEVTCSADNPKIPDSTISHVMRLDVHCWFPSSPALLATLLLTRVSSRASFPPPDMPHLELRLGSPTLSLHAIQEGNDVYFDCLVDANPWSSRSVAWKLDGAPLAPARGTVLLPPFPSLPCLTPLLSTHRLSSQESS